MKLHDEFGDRTEDFVILAFHDDRAKTLDELDAKLEPIREKVWGGRDLPFPILLDATGETIRTFGVRAFPTTVLVDPDGKVVRGGEHDLRRHLLETSQDVRLLIERLQGSFAEGLEEAVALGGERAGFALLRFSAEHASPEQIGPIGKALLEIGGSQAVQFFLGEHGLGASAGEARLAAARALEELATGRDLGGLIAAYNAEEDGEVRAALRLAIEQAKTR